MFGDIFGLIAPVVDLVKNAITILLVRNINLLLMVIL